MFVLRTLCIFFCAFVTFSESKFADTLLKCNVKDTACLKEQLNTALKTIYDSGAPELGIPPVDPIEFKDMKVNVMDLFEILITEGKAKGIKDCEVEKYKIDFENKHTTLKFFCKKLILEAKYKMSGSNPVLKTMFGGDSIHGDGNAVVTLEKIKFHFDLRYDVEKNGDGDIIFNYKGSKSNHKFDLVGKATFAADNIFIGNTDATDTVVSFLNQNDRFAMETGGKIFFEKAMELVYFYSSKFFSVVPTKAYFLDDFSQYLKN